MNRKPILTALLSAWILTLLTIISCSGNAQKDTFLPYNQLGDLPIRKVFGFGDKGMGIVLEDKVRFYFWYFYDETDWRENWKEDTDKTFTLPPNCKDVFGKGEGLGVVFEDKMVFYELLDSGWQEETDTVFMLPENCRGVFRFFTDIGVIVDDKIKFFSNDNAVNTWNELPDFEYTLPRNCQGIFTSEYGEFCIIGDNKLRFIYREDSNWIEATNAEFNLPDNFKGAFHIWRGWLGIVLENKIMVYNYFEDGWGDLSNVEFGLETLSAPFSMFGPVFQMNGTVLERYRGNAENVTIPEGVTAIENYAFADCYSLTSITIPSSVTAIGDRAFEGCENLKNIDVTINTEKDEGALMVLRLLSAIRTGKGESNE